MEALKLTGIALSACIALAACGGGGGSAPTAEAPTPQEPPVAQDPAPTPQEPPVAQDPAPTPQEPPVAGVQYLFECGYVQDCLADATDPTDSDTANKLSLPAFTSLSEEDVNAIMEAPKGLQVAYTRFRRFTNPRPYTAFDDWSPEPSRNDIPLSKATIEETGIEETGIFSPSMTSLHDVAGAYRGLLRHSMFLFQSEVVRTIAPPDYADYYRGGSQALSVGYSSNALPLPATWRGVAVGFETYRSMRPTEDVGCCDFYTRMRDGNSLAYYADKHVVKGDVEIRVLDVGSVREYDQGGIGNVRVAFSNWEGGIRPNPYPDIVFENSYLQKETLSSIRNEPPLNESELYYLNPARPHFRSNTVTAESESSGWEQGVFSAKFYGPNHEEVGGVFSFNFLSNRREELRNAGGCDESNAASPDCVLSTLEGVFGAKRTEE